MDQVISTRLPLDLPDSITFLPFLFSPLMIRTYTKQFQTIGLHLWTLKRLVCDASIARDLLLSPTSSNNLNLNFLITLNRFWHLLLFTGTLHRHVNHPGGVRLVHTRTFVIFRFRANRSVSILALEENEINRLIPS